MTSVNDAREFTRVLVCAEVTLENPDRDPVVGAIRDVSATGLFVECAGDASPGQFCDVRIILGTSTVAIRGRARVVRASAEGVALTFDALHGVESFQHLRRLITLNAGDVDRAESEFEAHAGLRPRDRV